MSEIENWKTQIIWVRWSLCLAQKVSFDYWKQIEAKVGFILSADGFWGLLTHELTHSYCPTTVLRNSNSIAQASALMSSPYTIQLLQALGHFFREEFSKFKRAFAWFWGGLNPCPDGLGHLFRDEPFPKAYNPLKWENSAWKKCPRVPVWVRGGCNCYLGNAQIEVGTSWKGLPLRGYEHTLVPALLSALTSSHFKYMFIMFMM